MFLVAIWSKLCQILIFIVILKPHFSNCNRNIEIMVMVYIKCTHYIVLKRYNLGSF